jgi:diguanylate cyclase (GGDEF)-like protein/PAS domain S-box-containing protein
MKPATYDASKVSMKNFWTKMLPNINKIRPRVIFGLVPMTLGVLTLCGWLFHVPQLLEIKSGMVPMVFNTGLFMFLAGCAITLFQGTDQTSRYCHRGIGIVLVLWGGATLVETIFDISVGIDLAPLQTWFDYANTRIGRMAPNTALGFTLIGATLLFLERVTKKAQAIIVVVLTFAVLGIGLTGLVGYFVSPDLLFGWARSARMAVHTAIGIICCALSLWMIWIKKDWYRSEVFFRADEKIRFLGSAILVVVTITVGLLGFVLLQQRLENELEARISAIMDYRLVLFNATVSEVSANSASAVRLSGLTEAGLALLQAPDSNAGRVQFSAIGQRLIAESYRAISIEDLNGRDLQPTGKFNPHPAMVAGLDHANLSELIWDEELVLRTRFPVVFQDKVLGYIVVDHSVASLRDSLFGTPQLGKTGEAAACLSQQGDIVCFPAIRHSEPFIVKKRGNHTAPLTVEFAIAGQSGVRYGLDYRKVNVLAAYAPLAPGFGFVVKQDTVEAFAPIREALEIGTPIILLTAVMGALLLYSQLRPLAAKMWLSERSASEKEREMRTIMGSVGDGIITIDVHSVIQSVNAAACDIFAYTADELIGNTLMMLMPIDLRNSHENGINHLLEGRSPHLIGQGNVEIRGLRKDGMEFPLELTISEVPLFGKRLFVGVMRDITERKEIHRKLSNLAQYDSLTGLPNRLLFMDRLSTAMERAKRSGATIALMFLDLDGFKQINDTLGHQAGDELLIQFADRMSSLMRKVDTVARLSGDEFNVLLEQLNAPEADAKRVAEKIVASMQKPFSIADQNVIVTVSVGIVVHDARIEDIQVGDLLSRADKQMYLAKNAGKNAFSMATPGIACQPPSDISL